MFVCNCCKKLSCEPGWIDPGYSSRNAASFQPRLFAGVTFEFRRAYSRQFRNWFPRLVVSSRKPGTPSLPRMDPDLLVPGGVRGRGVSFGTHLAWNGPRVAGDVAT